MNILGIIPARGGSKGIPRKNVRLLAGKPLIAHSIEAAKGSKLLTRFLVSTDDPEIAEVSEKWGAPVLERPKQIAEDQTAMSPVVRHALSQCKESVDVILLLQPTSPQRTAEDIDASLRLFDNPAVRSVISAYLIEDQHPGRMYYLKDGFLDPLFPEWIAIKRRQELPAVYQRNGAIFSCRREVFEERELLWDDHPAAYLMPRNRSINIDEPLDLAVAELLMSGNLPR